MLKKQNTQITVVHIFKDMFLNHAEKKEVTVCPTRF